MAQPLSKFGDYFLIKKIATGGMAEIYLARTRTAQGPEKYVALKMIHPRYMEDGNFHQMIVEEAKIAVQLNHKNIGTVFDLGQVEGRYFLVMEFIDGYDLSRLHEATRQKGMQIPIDVAAFVGREVCAALTYAHALHDPTGRPLDLIHRDISPQNILLGFDGEVKIIDFGIAKVSTQIQQTQVGVIKGKFYYMSPEQAGAHDVDQRSDLFSMGICMWETRSLFRREGGPTNPLAILHEIRTLRIPRVREVRPECPRELDEIVARALSRDLSTRFQSARQMQQALTRYLIDHVPGFERSRVANHMVTAFEKVEITKETQRVSTRMAELMSRGEFRPSQHSVIFALPTGQVVTPDPMDVHQAATGLLDLGKQSLATNIIDTSALQPLTQPIQRDESPSKVIAGISEGHADLSERATDRGLKKLSESDLAMSETVFIRKDDVEQMTRAGAAPEVRGDRGSEEDPAADPHSRTQSLAADEIAAAHQAYNEAISEERASHTAEVDLRNKKASKAPHPVASLPPLSRHPLFRLLVIGVLVLCVLSATLALLLVRRARQQHLIDIQKPHIIDTRTPKAEAPSDPPRVAQP